MKRPLEWAFPAQAAFDATIAKITREDVFTAQKTIVRVARSLALLQAQPELGLPASTPGIRTYAVPNTGHSINYRVTPHSIIILRWFRQRQSLARLP